MEQQNHFYLQGIWQISFKHLQCLSMMRATASYILQPMVQKLSCEVGDSNYIHEVHEHSDSTDTLLCNLKSTL